MRKWTLDKKNPGFSLLVFLSLSRNNELLPLLQIVFWSGFCWCRSRHFVPFKRKGNILCVCASRQSNESQVHNFKANSFHVCMIFFIAALYFSTFAVSSIQCIHCALLFAFFSGIFFFLFLCRLVNTEINFQSSWLVKCFSWEINCSIDALCKATETMNWIKKGALIISCAYL